MKVEELITVVIPVYNVENYLDECIKSIIQQTYSNLEIILVDDGSLDNSGDICDKYASLDNRIKVIHKDNGGLSSARNAGINIAKGKYITFVDSDDYLELDTIEILYHQIIANNAEISVVAFESFFENGKKFSNNHKSKMFVYSRTEAMDNFLFDDYLTPCVWGKLYKIWLWNDVRCPEGRLFEDQFTTYKLIDKCNKVVYITEPKYHYRKRSGSIGHSAFTYKTYDLYEAIQEEYKFISDKYAGKCPNIEVARLTWEIVFANMMIRSDELEEDVIRKIAKYARQNMKKVRACRYIKRKRKIQIALFAYFFPTYRRMYKVYVAINTIT